jgi:hypothetical protein
VHAEAHENANDTLRTHAFAIESREIRVALRESTERFAHAAQIVFVAIAGCGHPFPETFETDRAVHSESLSYEDVEIELPTLETHETELVLAIAPHDIGTGGLESVLLAARRHGVPVRAWLVLDDSFGYWPGERNLGEFREHVDEFWSWNVRAKLGVTRIVVDMAPPLTDSVRLATAFEQDRLADAIPVLVDNRDADAFAAAQADWADAVDDWHDDGMLVDVVALPHVLDDFADDDLELQDMFDSPIDGIDWDSIGFRVQQNLYGTGDARLGPDLVRSYAATARERYGAQATVVLGTIGDAGKTTQTSGYVDIEAMRADVSAAATAELTSVQLFSLDGMREQGGSALWLADLELTPAEIAMNPAVAQARTAIAGLDSM